MSSFQTLKPILWTNNLEETIAFYRDILHFELLNHDAALGWAALAHGNIEILLSLPNAHFEFKQPKFTGSFYFEIPDVDDFWVEITDKTKVCYPIENFEYGMREFAIFDNNGYLLQFGMALSNE